MTDFPFANDGKTDVDKEVRRMGVYTRLAGLFAFCGASYRWRRYQKLKEQENGQE